MVTFSNFRMLDPETADLARELVGSDNRQSSPFLPFMNTWMGFNGWMESVTDAANDRAMLTALADNRRMIDAYDALLRGEAFEHQVAAFSDLWPVLNVRDVRRKLGRDAVWQLDRDALLEECRRANVRIEPLGWTDGDVPTWAQVLRTVYLIRCNLFHGAKSPQNRRDRDLVRRADQVLRSFIEGSGCFEWYD